MTPAQEFLMNIGGFLIITIIILGSTAIISSLITPWFTRLRLIALEESNRKLWDEIYILKHPKDTSQ
jgi:energy-converting hydrogenase Eha subunit A